MAPFCKGRGSVQLAFLILFTTVSARNNTKTEPDQPSRVTDEDGGKINVCFYYVTDGAEPAFVASLVRGDTPRAVRFGSGRFQYDSTNRTSTVATHTHHKYSNKARTRLIKGTVNEKDDQACDAFLAILRIKVKLPGLMFKNNGLDFNAFLPPNIAAKSVRIAFTENCITTTESKEVVQFRESGTVDAVWYHNGHTDPESTLNLPLGPAYTMPFTSAQQAAERTASKRTFFYNIVMSSSTGVAVVKTQHVDHTTKETKTKYKRITTRRKWQDKNTMWNAKLAAVAKTRRHSVCTFASITKKWQPPDWLSPTNCAGEEGSSTRLGQSTQNCNNTILSRRTKSKYSATKQKKYRKAGCSVQKPGSKISQDEYREVLLDSAFTLAPAGHNVECFRMWEAAEAGSIPVLLINETSVQGGNVTRTGCSLHPDVATAPFLWATSLDDAWTQMSTLGNDHDALNARSRAVRAWYGRYMTNSIGQFESLLEKAVRRGRGTGGSETPK